jgi:hypothetical protein
MQRLTEMGFTDLITPTCFMKDRTEALEAGTKILAEIKLEEQEEAATRRYESHAIVE